MQQIADWLEKLGLAEYAQRFADNAIDCQSRHFAVQEDSSPRGTSQTCRVRRDTVLKLHWA